MRRRLFFAAMFSACCLAGALHATSANDEREHDVLLTIVLPEASDGSREMLHLTLDDLKSRPRAEFATTTIWTSGEQTFSGVWMHALLHDLGISDGKVDLVALNDYRISVPVSEFQQGGALLAYERNGMPMAVRENGPLWLVYDYDSDPKYRSESFYARSVWQLDRMIISR